VYHTFIVRTAQRDALKQYLQDHGVDTKVHYPVPIHLQEAARGLGYKAGDFPVTERQCTTILSLPVFPELKDAQVDHVADTIIAFFQSRG
jgi:dTDP-4-amino-4,6-dideoxygalactose transaminase